MPAAQFTDQNLDYLPLTFEPVRASSLRGWTTPTLKGVLIERVLALMPPVLGEELDGS